MSHEPPSPLWKLREVQPNQLGNERQGCLHASKPSSVVRASRLGDSPWACGRTLQARQTAAHAQPMSSPAPAPCQVRSCRSDSSHALITLPLTSTKTLLKVPLGDSVRSCSRSRARYAVVNVVCIVCQKREYTVHSASKALLRDKARHMKQVRAMQARARRAVSAGARGAWIQPRRAVPTLLTCCTSNPSHTSYLHSSKQPRPGGMLANPPSHRPAAL